MFYYTTILLVSVLLTVSMSHDLLLGYPDTGSKLIYNKVHQENPAIWVRSKVIEVNCTEDQLINAVQVLDLREDKMGDVFVTHGGIGHKHVTIELDSPSAFRGYNFWVSVYSVEAHNFLRSHGRK